MHLRVHTAVIVRRTLSHVYFIFSFAIALEVDLEVVHTGGALGKCNDEQTVRDVSMIVCDGEECSKCKNHILTQEYMITEVAGLKWRYDSCTYRTASSELPADGCIYRLERTDL